MFLQIKKVKSFLLRFRKVIIPVVAAAGIGAGIILTPTLPDYLNEPVGCIKDEIGAWVSFDLITGEYHKDPLIKGISKKTSTSSPTLAEESGRFIGKKSEAPCVFWEGKSLKDYSNTEINAKVIREKLKTSGLFKKAYAALQFNAVTDQVNFGDNYDFTFSDTFTVEAWFNRTATTTCGIVMNKIEYYLIGWDWLSECSNAGEMDFRMGDMASPNRTECRFDISGSPTDDGAWHHVATTFNAGAGCANVQAYIDGVSRTVTQDYGGSITGANSHSFALGAETVANQNQSFVGFLDEVRIWNSVRTSDQINNGRWIRISDQPGLLGYWRTDEGTGTTIYPYSSNASSSGVTGSMSSVDWADSAPINYPN